MNIDLKADSDLLKEKVYTLIKQHKRQHLTVIGSAKGRENDKIRAMVRDDPSLFTFFSAKVNSSSNLSAGRREGGAGVPGGCAATGASAGRCAVVRVFL